MQSPLLLLPSPIDFLIWAMVALTTGVPSVVCETTLGCCRGPARRVGEEDDGDDDDDNEALDLLGIFSKNYYLSMFTVDLVRNLLEYKIFMIKNIRIMICR